MDVGTLDGRFVKLKPSNLWKGKGLLGLEFGAGIFDNRLLKEMLEKKARLTSAPPADTPVLLTTTQDAQSAEGVWYYQGKYRIGAGELLPALGYPLREWVYRA